jgi:hypothetical protein
MEIYLKLLLLLLFSQLSSIVKFLVYTWANGTSHTNIS